MNKQELKDLEHFYKKSIEAYKKAKKDCEEAEEKTKQECEEYSKLRNRFLKFLDNKLGTEGPKAKMRVMNKQE